MGGGKVEGSHGCVPGTEPVKKLHILNLEVQNIIMIISQILTDTDDCEAWTANFNKMQLINIRSSSVFKQGCLSFYGSKTDAQFWVGQGKCRH